MGRFTNYTQDYNILAPDDMDSLLFSAFDQALGKETRERIRQQAENYEYYDGKQHKDKYGNLVVASELERPPNIDYDPTRYATNYFKAIVDKKSRWQMSGNHTFHVPRQKIDDEVESVTEGYVPSSRQQKENDRAINYEHILHQLWEENRQRPKLMQAARDRLIANRAVCKIAFNSRTGKLRWIWRPDTEFIPIYSDDDFEEMIACHFVRQMVVDKGGEEVEAIRKQTFRLDDNMGECYIEESIYEADSLDLLKQITPETPMGLDFIPVVEVPVDELLGGETSDGEISQLREQNDVLNQMNEDAIDSLKFEMFSMTAIMNAPEGTASKLQISPGAILEIIGAQEGQPPDVKKVEGGFRWKEAFKDQYGRVKGAMHEVSGLPQIVPQELNFGGLNGDALQVLFHDIISDTEEHWLAWEHGLTELHEKSIRYLQARTGEPNFAYDVREVNSIDDYRTEMKFQLPLPDNRKELVELVDNEVLNDFESKRGAMERLGVNNVQAKMEEIESEKLKDKLRDDPYAGLDDDHQPPDEDDKDEDIDDLEVGGGRKLGGSRGEEPVITCPTCGGSGVVTSQDSGETVKCSTCGGKGYIQERKR